MSERVISFALVVGLLGVWGATRVVAQVPPGGQASNPVVVQPSPPSGMPSEPPRPQSSGALGSRAPGVQIANERNRHNARNNVLLRNGGFHGDLFPGSGPAPSLAEQLAPGFVGPPGTGGILEAVLPQDNFGEALLKTIVQALFSMVQNVSALLNFLDPETFFVNLLSGPGGAPAPDTGLSTVVPGNFFTTTGQ